MSRFTAIISQTRKMDMPYRCLERCGKVLIAARGSSIDLFNLDDGSLLSTWKCPSAQKPKRTEQGTTSPLVEQVSNHLETPKSEDIVLHSSSPLAKKRKLSAAGEDAARNSSKRQGKKEANDRSDAVVSGLEAPALIALAVTRNGQHVVAVTAEEKSIRVFENVIEGDGKQCLKQLSQRSVVLGCRENAYTDSKQHYAQTSMCSCNY
jgi:tRNA (guanine-N(7)-)-methyltransferase subunit TRM82